jgi:hypothetical protein
MTNDERDLNQAWDEFLGLDPDGRETFAAASDDEATIRELHLRYRPPVPSVEFRERLIQSIPKVLPRTASETIPASSVPAVWMAKCPGLGIRDDGADYRFDCDSCGLHVYAD